MGSLRRKKYWNRQLILVLLAAGFSFTGYAQSTYIGPDMGTWSVDANWNPRGVPGAGANVQFVTSDSLSRTLVYDYTGPDVTLGAFTIDQTVKGNSVNTFSMASGTFSTDTEFVAQLGQGAFIQSGGTHNVTNSITVGPGGYSWINGHYTLAASNGTYSMSGDAVLKAGSVNLGGDQSTGTFTQNGGSATIGTLAIGREDAGLGASGVGFYTLSSGKLSVGIESLAGTQAEFNQTGGDHTTNVLLIAIENNGQYTLSDGTLTVLGDDSFSGGGEYLGYTAYANAIFNQTGGTHVVKANVLLLGRGTATIGTYNLSGGSLTTPETQLGESGTAVFNQTGGTHTTGLLFLGQYSSSKATYTLSDGTLTASQTTNNRTITQTGGTASLGPVDGTGSISVSAGSLAATHLRQAALSLSGSGQITIAPGGGAAGVSRVASLVIDLSGAATARFDLADNGLVVDYAAASPLPAVRAALHSAYAGGTWSGPGLTTTSAAADPSRALSAVEAADLLHLVGSDTAVWNGQTVDATTVLVGYALAGDVNLDGTVGFADLVAVAQNYGREDGGANWLQGDLTYDGNVDFADLVKLAQNYGAGQPQTAMAGANADFQGDLAAAFASVPEPSAPILFLMTAVGLTLRPRLPRAKILRI